MDQFNNDFENLNNVDATETEIVGDMGADDELKSKEVFDDQFNGFNAFEDDTVYFEDETENISLTNNTPVFDNITFSSVESKNRGTSNKGVKVFSIILAIAIALSGACFGGYYIGKNSNKTSSNVKVDLDAKPKKTDEYTAAQVYDMLNESIVGIRVYNAAGSAADASGVVYSKDGYIVTNDHSYAEIAAPKFKVYTFDGTEYDAVYVAGDTVSDLAVLKIKGNNFKAATFGDSRELIFGENVVAIGRPNDATSSSSISKGIVSAVSRRVTTTSSYSARLIQTDSAINPGSSGGALVNMYGQVIGITSSKLAGVQYDAVGFAIPTVTMKRVVEQLIANGRVIDRAKLGISYAEINSVTAEMNNFSTTGLHIEAIDEESDLFGKVTKGAIITHINGNKITNDDMVLDTIDDCKAGDKIVVTILLTNGTSKDFTVKLRANVGQSSYSENLNQSDNSSSGGTFDFPFGE